MATDPRYIREVRRIVAEGLKAYPAEVYWFGSRATGSEHRYSDVDIGVLPLQEIPAGVWLDLQERLEESWVPYSVDLVDLIKVAPAFQRRVLTEGIRWNV